MLFIFHFYNYHYHRVLNFVAAAGKETKVEREGMVIGENENEMKKETKRETKKEKEIEMNNEKERQGERVGEGEGKGKGKEERMSENFSVVGVLDAPLGALLLYYLPNTKVQEEEEEEKIGKGKNIVIAIGKGKGKEEMGTYQKAKRGREREIGRGSEREREGEVTDDMNYEQTTAFCVIDLVWLLQLKERCTSLDNCNDSNNNYNGNARNTQNRPIGPVERLNSPNKIENRKGKSNEKTAKDYYNTTMKKRETVDRVFFLKNTLVVITKSFSGKISHQNDGISSVEVPDPHVNTTDKMTVGKLENKIAIEMTKAKTLTVGNYKNIENNDSNNNDNYDNNNNNNNNSDNNNDNSDNNNDNEKDHKNRNSAERSVENIEGMKVIGGTIYVLSFNGKRFKFYLILLSNITHTKFLFAIFLVFTILYLFISIILYFFPFLIYKTIFKFNFVILFSIFKF